MFNIMPVYTYSGMCIANFLESVISRHTVFKPVNWKLWVNVVNAA